MAGSQKSRFDEIWLSRIGEEATAELRHNGNLTLLLGPALIVLPILAGLCFGRGTTLGSLVGGAAVLLALVVFAVWLRSRTRFAGLVEVVRHGNQCSRASSNDRTAVRQLVSTSKPA